MRAVNDPKGIGKTIFQDQTSDSTYTYYGYAQPGTRPEDPLWKIERVAKDSDEKLVTYAGGTVDYVHRWVDRLTLEYS